MKKIVILISIFSAATHAASITIDNKKIECPQEDKMYLCHFDNREILVLKLGYSYGAIEMSKNGILPVVRLNKIEEGGKVLLQQSLTATLQQMTQIEAIKFNQQIIENLKKSAFQSAQNFVLRAETYLKEHPLSRKFKVTVKGNKNPYECIQGSTDEKQKKCEYYECSSKDKSEKILGYFPFSGDSFKGPHLLSMKDGQAVITENNLNVTDDTNIPVFKSWPTGYMDGGDVDPNLFIPSRYNKSKSSFETLSNPLSVANFTNGQDFCDSKSIKSLFAEEKKIAEEMQKHLAEADLIEYLKVIDGRVHSYFVDREKGIKAGCFYQNKILDNSVLGRIGYLDEVAPRLATKKYLTPLEVQALFVKAKNMSDIPFGYKSGGCEARAHLMARRFEEMGVKVEKVWIKGDLSIPGKDEKWDWHVAPVVEVKDGKGNIEKYVIDPSVNDQAVLLDEWVNSIDKKAEGHVIKTTYPLPDNQDTFHRTVVAISSTTAYSPTESTELSEAQKMAMSIKTLKENAEKLKQVER